jgi:hypothetical protein
MFGTGFLVPFMSGTGIGILENKNVLKKNLELGTN